MGNLADTDTTLSEALVAMLDRPVTAETRSRAARHVLDWVGCALIGAQEPLGRALSVIGGAQALSQAGRGTDQAVATLGGLGSLLEMDDVHKAALLHPGPVIVPVIMALPGPDPLAAMVQGYEAMIRLGRSVGRAHYAMFHNTGTCGGIGAAVAAARLMGLDRQQTVWAIGHALSMAGGLWQTRNERSDTKHLHVAEAARRGVLAARYAAQGLAGPRAILEGPQGFFAAMAPDGTPETVIAPAEDWAIGEVSFKPWPACRHVHPAMDAALALRNVAGAEPARIEVATYRDALVFCDRPSPLTAAEARFSLQHAVAVALQDGVPAPDAFLPKNLPRYEASRQCVTLREDPGLTARYPAHFGATVTLHTSGAAPQVQTVADAWGDPENPMDTGAVLAKFHRLAAAAHLTEARATALATAVFALPETGSMDAVRHLLAQE